jgi:hypothetical protein
MNKDLEKLGAYFPKESEAILKKGGRNLTYIPVGEVIMRANEVLGFNWSYEVVDTFKDGDWITAHVRLTITTDDTITSRDGFGGQKVKYTKSGDAVDLGDEYKGAVSDALKKAFQSFGVGLYLARDESLDSTFEQGVAPVDLPVEVPPTSTVLEDPGVTPITDLRGLAERAKQLGVFGEDGKELRQIASDVLGKPIKKATDIASLFDIETVQSALDDIEIIQQEEKK